MSLRAPQSTSSASAAEQRLDAFGHEMLAEKAASLGHAGRQAELTVRRLREFDGAPQERRLLLKQAADAVYGYFVQRELCGFRRHQDIIREYGIPNEVLVRLGAR